MPKAMILPRHSPGHPCRSVDWGFHTTTADNDHRLRGMHMLDKTLANIERKITEASSIGEKERADLLELLTTLKGEVTELSKSQADRAESIAGFTQVSAHEATRAKQNPNLVQLSLKGLASSVDELEATHPNLVETVNRISHILSNMGI